MFEGMHLSEGGQSAAGALIDHVIETHAAYGEAKALAAASGVPVSAALNERLEEMAREGGLESPHMLARGVHVTPDFLGNRSPLADPLCRGAVTGLPLSATLDDLATLYLAVVQSLACQTRHILEEMEVAGHDKFEAVFCCGGLSKNPLYVKAHADILGVPIVLPECDEAVLLGSAVLAAAASGAHPSVAAAMAAMTRAGETVVGDGGEVERFCDRKYIVFRRMVDDQMAYREIMK